VDNKLAYIANTVVRCGGGGGGVHRAADGVACWAVGKRRGVLCLLAPPALQKLLGDRRRGGGVEFCRAAGSGVWGGRQKPARGVFYLQTPQLPPTTPLLHISLRLVVLASAPPNPIPQSLTGASRGAIEGVYVPTILSSFLSAVGKKYSG
jgi:hypothetical protein